MVQGERRERVSQYSEQSKVKPRGERLDQDLREREETSEKGIRLEGLRQTERVKALSTSTDPISKEGTRDWAGL